MAALFLVGWLAGAVAVSAQEQPRERPPLDTGLVETTGVTLMLVDVRVTDRKGRPMRGLSVEDFRVLLNGDPWPVESADDLCGCADSAAEQDRVHAGPLEDEPPGAGEAQTLEAPAPTVAVAASPMEPPQFVLYLDFSQLGLDGRFHALEEARRWVRETMRPDDRAMFAAYAGDAGLEVLTGFTSDKPTLLAAIEQVAEEPRFQDPFPAAYRFRLDRCNRCCEDERKRPGCNCALCWELAAEEERGQGKRSFRGLQRLLERLQGVPGRKAMLLFNQRGTLFPARYYPLVTDAMIGDHIAALDQVAAEATLARTAVYPAFVGENRNRLATNFGANLADLTGGAYNRRIEDLAELTEEAGRGCECVYRLGLAPPERADHVYMLKVEVKGRKLPGTFRVQQLSPAEKWMRAARAVLSNPEAARAIPVVAAIRPVEASGGAWTVAIQIALEPDSLELLPTADAGRSNWEVGALLADDEEKHSWEWLAISELYRAGKGEIVPALLHEANLDGVKPGTYVLTAFVRDRWTDLYGAASTTIALPEPRGYGLGGPVVLRGSRHIVRAELPRRTKKGIKQAPVRTTEVAEGPVPIAEARVNRGEPLEFVAWVCPKTAAEEPSAVKSYVARDGEPLFRLDSAEFTPAGDCMSRRDRLATSPMEPGHYTYHLRWEFGTGRDPVAAECSFEVGQEEPADSPTP